MGTTRVFSSREQRNIGVWCGPVWDVERGEVETGVSVTGDGQCMGAATRIHNDKDSRHKRAFHYIEMVKQRYRGIAGGIAGGIAWVIIVVCESCSQYITFNEKHHSKAFMSYVMYGGYVPICGQKSLFQIKKHHIGLNRDTTEYLASPINKMR